MRLEFSTIVGFFKVPHTTEMSMAARQRQIFKQITAVAVDFLKILRDSGSIFFEDIKKVHEFDRILVFTSETL
jgi:hypothetical protein